MSEFASIEQAVADVAAGKPVIVVDDADRENEGDLIFAAQQATPELLAFTVRHTSGFICAPMTEAECEDRKSTRLNSSHVAISYAVFCLKKKKSQHTTQQPRTTNHRS